MYTAHMACTMRKMNQYFVFPLSYDLAYKEKART
jgi:hypothetical protein